MTLPASSLRAFLATAKRQLQSAITKQEKVSFVIGNESADLDSITSSIIFAYLGSFLQQQSSGQIYVPLINIPRADIRIRAELLKLLPYANIEPDQLITLDDLPPISKVRDQLKPENTRWILVDHNALQGPLSDIYASRVLGCIDHHVEENKVPEDTDGEPRIIKPTGSCTSLVVNHFRDSWESISQASSQSNSGSGQSDVSVGNDDAAVRRTWDAQIARLALASILVDTSNLKAKEKVTADDENAVEYLESRIINAPKSGGKLDRHAFFKEINKAKKNLNGLTLDEKLRKDYKQWNESGLKIGVCSVAQSVSNLLSESEDSKIADKTFVNKLDSFAGERDLSLLAVMTKSNSPSGVFQKEILLLPRDDSAKSAIEKFEKSSKEELELDSWREQPQLMDEINSMKIWFQLNTKMTRKQVAPMLREAAHA